MIPFFSFDDDEFFGDLLLMGAAGGGKAVEATATGNPLTFLTDLARPLKSLLIPFTPQQEGTGDPSPENIRPILPWNGLTVWNGGANLFDGNYVTGLIQNTTESAWYRNTGTSAKSAIIPCRPNTQYTIHKIGYASSNRFSIGLTSEYPENNMPVTLVVEDSGQGEKQRTFTTGANDHFIIVYVSTGSEMAEPDMMVNFGSIALPYVPYHQITETDIVFPSPVYGGEHEAVSGELTSVYASDELTGTNVASYGTASTGVPYVRMTTQSVIKNNGKVLCDSYKTLQSVPQQGNSGCRITNQTLFIYDDRFTSESVAKELLTANPIQCVYELATPVEIQLTQQQINAIKGDNTIWSDADGSMTAVYLKKG